MASSAPVTIASSYPAPSPHAPLLRCRHGPPVAAVTSPRRAAAPSDREPASPVPPTSRGRHLRHHRRSIGRAGPSAPRAPGSVTSSAAGSSFLPRPVRLRICCMCGVSIASFVFAGPPPLRLRAARGAAACAAS
ncbi:hypothetical protein BDY21DRAFT_45595 [Lineolata rhizophorae]|uniref:Uncharacterized protein n=1 Tax=Lineolata rhizophorae TaxID=578093 RepID=A0A6A6NZD8_9PEZI|nr:hypothetical protein BDY21DRAFT_45595 [Lineolata rhizophorae]